ncbi:hypothetical protein ES705_29738 [subsurface metagenome]
MVLKHPSYSRLTLRRQSFCYLIFQLFFYTHLTNYQKRDYEPDLQPL